MKIRMNSQMKALLYYPEAVQGEAYVERPTHQLEVSRLVAGKKKYWPAPSSDAALRPKNIIFVDWTWKNDSFLTKKYKRELLEHLLTGAFGDSFDIWVRKRGHLVKVTKTNAHVFLCDAKLEQTGGYTKDRFTPLLIEENLSEESIAWLDHVAFKRMLSGEECGPYVPLAIHQSSEQINYQLLVMKSFYPDSDVMIGLEVYSEELLECWPKVEASFPGKTKETVTRADVKYPLEEGFDLEKGVFVRPKCSLNLRDIKEVNLTDSGGCSSAQAYINLFKHMVSCRSLGMENESRNRDATWCSLERYAPPDIEALNFKFTALGNSLPALLLSSKGTLKYLEVHNSYQLGDLSSLEGNSLPHLQSLTLHHMEKEDLPVSSFQGLVAAASHLTKLEMIELYHPSVGNQASLRANYFKGWIDPPLNHLTTLKLCGFNPIDYARVLEACSDSLEILTLHRPEVKGVFVLKKKMVQLLSLTITEYRGDPAWIASLLRACPRLVSLRLNNCRLETEDDDTSQFHDLHLPVLTRIKTKSSTFSLEIIHGLFKASPRLETIKTKECTIIGDADCAGMNLAYLTELGFRGNVGCRFVTSVLNATAQLTQFILHLGYDLRGHEKSFVQEKVGSIKNLLQLEAMSIKTQGVPLQWFQGLLDASPLLKSLELNCFGWLGSLGDAGPKNHAFKTETFACLENLHLNEVDMGVSRAILLAAKKSLRTLSIIPHSSGRHEGLRFFQGIILTRLEKLGITGSHLRDIDWGELLIPVINAAPQLETFSLNSCRIVVPAIPVRTEVWHTATVTVDQSMHNIPEMMISALVNKDRARAKIEREEAERTQDRYAINPLSASGVFSGGGGSKQRALSNPSARLPRMPNKYVRDTRSSQNRKGDVNTAPLKNTHRQLVRKIYSFDGKHPHPREYRENNYDTLRVNLEHCASDNAFTLSCNESDPSTLKPMSIPSSAKDLSHLGALQQQVNPRSDYFYAKDSILSSLEWTRLLSVSSEDSITLLKVTPSTPYEIAYNTEAHCYMIRFPSEKVEIVEIETVFCHPATPSEVSLKSDEEAQDLAAIQALVAELNQYGEGALDLTDCQTGSDYLQAIKTQKKGSCRHRSFVLKWVMDTQYPQYRTRVITNACHAFVEIEIAGSVLRFDLGGYPLGTTQFLDSSNVSDFDICIVSKKIPNASTPLALDEKKGSDDEGVPDAAAHRPVTLDQTAQAADGVEGKDQDTSLYGHNEKQVEVREAAPQEKAVTEEKAVAQEETVPMTDREKKSLLRDLYAIQYARNTVKLKDQHERVSSLLTADGANHLFVSKDTHDHQAALLELYESAKEAGHLVHLIRHPDELDLYSGLIKDANNNGIRTEEACGRLHDFFMLPNSTGLKRLLFIDFSCFTQQDIIRTNAMSDDTRMLGSQALPEDVSLMAFQNLSQKNAYTGADFYRRYTVIKDRITRRDSDDLMGAVPDTETKQENVKINLYHSQVDWESRLCGRWKLNENRIWFQDGPLIQALKQTQTSGKARVIEIINAPLDDPNYQLFWKKLVIDGEIEGLPIDFRYVYHDPEPHCELLDTVEPTCSSFVEADSGRYLLNPETVFKLFVNFFVDEKHSLVLEKGLLKQASEGGKSDFSVLLTAPLPRYQWAELLDLAQEHKIHIDVQTLPGVPVTQEELGEQPESDQSLTAFEVESPHPFVYSTNLDVTVSMLLKQAKGDGEGDAELDVIDVTECQVSELFETVTADATVDPIVFTHKKHALLRALEETDKKILLTGDFSTAFLAGLLPYMQQYPNRIQCITDNEEIFRSLGCHVHDLPPASVNTDAFRCLDDASLLVVEACDPSSAKEKSAAFFTERVRSVQTALVDHPYVFISGYTGVGKSTFIQYYFPDALWGMEYFTEWANNPVGGVLFIDEANIDQRQWSEFEGLFHTPPRVLINGEFKPLSSKHKVIFAGNPLKAGGDRHIPRLFKRHGNAVVFQPLTANVMYQEVLLPIVTGTCLADRLEALAKPLLEAYNIMVALSDESIRVTPRQLKSIVMMTVACCEKDSTLNPLAVMSTKARAVLLPLLDAKDQACLDAVFPPDETHSDDEEEPYLLGDNFWVTPSRQAALDRLNDLLDLRAYQHRHHVAGDLNESQRCGGISSLVIEGMPATGKTELLQASMQQAGFSEAQYDSAGRLLNADSFDTYHMMAATLSVEQKTSRLIQAFQAGHVVILDEINTWMMEKLLNELEMGTYQGKAASTPGFVVLGTQNPYALGYRKKASTAQKKRRFDVCLPDYTRQEMIQIALKASNVPVLHVEVLVDLFLKKRSKNPEEPLGFSDFLSDLHSCADQVPVMDAAIARMESIQQAQRQHLKALEREKQKRDSHTHSATPMPRFTSEDSKVIERLEPVTEISARDQSLESASWVATVLLGGGGIAATVVSQCVTLAPSWTLLLGIAALLLTAIVMTTGSVFASKRQKTLLFLKSEGEAVRGLTNAGSEL